MWMYHSLEEWKHSLFGCENIFSFKDEDFAFKLKENFLDNHLSHRCYIIIEQSNKINSVKNLKVEVWRKNQISDNIFQIFFFQEPLKYVEEIGLWRWNITSDIPNMELLGTYFMDSGIFYAMFSIKSTIFSKLLVDGIDWIDEESSSYENLHAFEEKVESLLLDEFYNMYPTYESLPKELQDSTVDAFKDWAKKEIDKKNKISTTVHMDIMEAPFLSKGNLFSSNIFMEKIEYLEYIDAKKRACKEEEQEILKTLMDRNRNPMLIQFARKMLIGKLKKEAESKLSYLESTYMLLSHKL